VASLRTERDDAIRAALDHILAGDKDKALGTLIIATWAQALAEGLYDEEAAA
jgi:hypothetical protein